MAPMISPSFLASDIPLAVDGVEVVCSVGALDGSTGGPRRVVALLLVVGSAVGVAEVVEDDGAVAPEQKKAPAILPSFSSLSKGEQSMNLVL